MMTDRHSISARLYHVTQSACAVLALALLAPAVSAGEVAFESKLANWHGGGSDCCGCAGDSYSGCDACDGHNACNSCNSCNSCSSCSSCSSCDGCNSCDSCNGCGSDVPWTLRPWIGGTHFDGATTESGFAYGMIAGYRLADSLGVYGSFGFNHTDDRTQFVGTTGFQKFGNPYGATTADRMTLWGFWDYYADDETDDDAHQIRFNVGYVTGDYAEIGVTFSISTSNNSAGAIVPFGAANGMFVGDGFVGAYYNRTIGRLDFFGQLGFTQATDDVAGSIGLRWSTNSRIRPIASFAAAGPDSYGGMIGVELGLWADDTITR